MTTRRSTDPAEINTKCTACGAEAITGERWISCDKCEKWYHADCAIPDVDEKGESWSCSFCIPKNVSRENPADAKISELTKERDQLAQQVRAMVSLQDFSKLSDVLDEANTNLDRAEQLRDQMKRTQDEIAEERDVAVREKEKLTAEKDQLEIEKAQIVQQAQALQEKLGLKTRMTSLPRPNLPVTCAPLETLLSTEAALKASAESQQKANERMQKTRKTSVKMDDELESHFSGSVKPSVNSRKKDETQHDKVKKSTETERISKHEFPTFAEPQRESDMSAVAAAMQQLVVTQSLEPLPKFNGSDAQWPLFLAAYKEQESEAKLSEPKKLARLRAALEGPAKALVLGQLTCGKTAEGVMTLLRDEYGRVDEATQRMTDEILRFPVIPNHNKAALVKFSNALTSYTMQLEAMDQKATISNDYVLNQLVEKLVKNESLYSRWKQMKRQMSALDIAELAKFLREKARDMPSASQDKSMSAATQPSTANKNGKLYNVHQIGEDDCKTCCAFYAHAHTTDDDEQVMYIQPRCKDCAYCGAEDSHMIYQCRQFKKLQPSERFGYARTKKLCFSCLSNEHMAPDCDRKRTCGVDGCDKDHSRLLHLPKKDDKPGTPQLRANAAAYQPRQENHGQTPESSYPLHHQVHHDDQIQLNAKVVAVRVHGRDGKFHDTYAFLDDGSSITMMEQHILSKLGISGRHEELRLCWTKGITRIENAEVCNVLLSGISSRQIFEFKNVYGVSALELQNMSQNGSELAQRYRHLRGLPLPDFIDIRPEILIGLEHATFLNGPQVTEGKPDEPVAAKTKLGWVVYGCQRNPLRGVNTSGRHAKQRVVNVHTRLSHSKEHEDQDLELHELVKNFFATEGIGVSPTFKSREDVQVDKIINSTLKFENRRYEVGLLWLADDVTLPDSSGMAMKRLESEERKLRKDPASLNWMNAHVQQLLSKEYARKATKEDLGGEWPRRWICPLFAVINKNKIPPKRRCVADTAAKVNGVSLNSKLLKGPDNLIALTLALCRAREQHIMVTADVAEMFHQMRIIKEDQQCQRFLWRDGDQNRAPDVYVMQAMMFGPTCSPSVAQIVKNQHAEKYRSSHPEASEALQKFMYVDDYFNSHATLEEAVRVTRDAVNICADMSFDLVQLQSNSDGFLEQMPDRHVKQEAVSLNLDDGTVYTTKILGMFWRPNEDVLVFKSANNELAEAMVKGFCPTKREALSTLMKVFDPLRLAAKFIVRGKCVMQEIWRERIEWDEKIPDELADEWLEFLKSLAKLESVRIPRWYAPVDPRECIVELITFVDASEKAYAAVSYFRIQRRDEVHVALVMAKTKVAPLKPLSIPRLELEAARLGSRLAKKVGELHSFKIDQRMFFSDSKCVLAQIGSSHFKFKPFVAHRVGEILELTGPEEWSYVPTTENAADDATKTNKPNADEETSRWFCGPSFLKNDRSEWPIEARDQLKDDPLDKMIHVHLRNMKPVNEHPVNLIEPKFRRSWVKLCNVVARMIRINHRISRPAAAAISNHVTAEESRLAEDEIFSVIQRESFEEEWNEVHEWSRNPSSEKFDSRELKTRSPLHNMQLTMSPNEKVMRLVTRDRHSSRSYAAKNLIILPRHHELVQLYLQHVHQHACRH